MRIDRRAFAFVVVVVAVIVVIVAVVVAMSVVVILEQIFAPGEQNIRRKFLGESPNLHFFRNARGCKRDSSELETRTKHRRIRDARDRRRAT